MPKEPLIYKISLKQTYSSYVAAGYLEQTDVRFSLRLRASAVKFRFQFLELRRQATGILTVASHWVPVLRYRYDWDDRTATCYSLRHNRWFQSLNDAGQSSVFSVPLWH